MNRPETVEERRKAWSDKMFNKESNEVTRTIIMQKMKQDLLKQNEEIKTILR